VRFWRRRPNRRAESELDERGETIGSELLERGMRDLDERSGFFGRLERRLLPKHESERRGEKS
jgi:hypothetical protein